MVHLVRSSAKERASCVHSRMSKYLLGVHHALAKLPHNKTEDDQMLNRPRVKPGANRAFLKRTCSGFQRFSIRPFELAFFSSIILRASQNKPQAALEHLLGFPHPLAQLPRDKTEDDQMLYRPSVDPGANRASRKRTCSGLPMRSHSSPATKYASAHTCVLGV